MSPQDHYLEALYMLREADRASMQIRPAEAAAAVALAQVHATLALYTPASEPQK